MSLDDTFDIVPTKYGTVKITTEDLFFNCPGSLNRKEYNDELWSELIRNDHAVCVSVPEACDYNIYAVSEDGKLQEYRILSNTDLIEKYENKSDEEIMDTRLEYEGFIYVDPKLMVCDPASFVTGDTITVDTLKQSIKDKETIFCDFGVEPNGNCILIYIFQIFDGNDEMMEFRLTSNLELAKKYSAMLPSNDLETITKDLEESKI